MQGHGQQQYGGGLGGEQGVERKYHQGERENVIRVIRMLQGRHLSRCKVMSSVEEVGAGAKCCSTSKQILSQSKTSFH